MRPCALDSASTVKCHYHSMKLISYFKITFILHTPYHVGIVYSWCSLLIVGSKQKRCVSVLVLSLPNMAKNCNCNTSAKVNNASQLAGMGNLPSVMLQLCKRYESISNAKLLPSIIFNYRSIRYGHAEINICWRSVHYKTVSEVTQIELFSFGVYSFRNGRVRIIIVLI